MLSIYSHCYGAPYRNSALYDIILLLALVSAAKAVVEAKTSNNATSTPQIAFFRTLYLPPHYYNFVRAILDSRRVRIYGCDSRLLA